MRLSKQNYLLCQDIPLLMHANVSHRVIRLLSLHPIVVIVSHHLSFRCCERLRMAACRRICQSRCILPGWDSCCKCAWFRVSFKRKGPLDWYIVWVYSTIGPSLSNNRLYKLATTGFSLYALWFYFLRSYLYQMSDNKIICVYIYIYMNLYFICILSNALWLSHSSGQMGHDTQIDIQITSFCKIILMKAPAQMGNHQISGAFTMDVWLIGDMGIIHAKWPHMD